ncbi:unnamed protein product [Blepharisma stoltei]|uniref:TNFR-Cys domain-containing protein n=1 Tax=Blepharisma stoltei TaxID=1481888 RepID=A0AAU9J8S8_9CILI|nr:unnamed protein product [Blepharisma stoltei]
MNIWIFPISSGVIFKTKIGTLEFIKIEALSGNYQMSLLLKDQLNFGNNDLEVRQASGLSNAWESVTFQFMQTAYNSIDFQIIINNAQTAFIISDKEANFPNGSYDWVIGDPANSFQGFIYWIQVNSDNTINFPAISPPTCQNSYYYDGSNCQLCSGSCQNWPWCVRSENCLVCKNLDCTACNGYENSMCTSCNTGLAPGCCDSLCDVCSQTWSCSTCKAGKFLIDGVCLNSCPYGFGSCATNTGILISTDFNVPFAGSYGIFTTGTDSSSYQFFDTPETIDPVPSQNRGLYFSSGKYLAGAIDLSHTFTISLWIRPESGDILGNSYGSLKVSSAGLVTLLLDSWDNTSTASLSNSVLISASSWKYLSFSINFSNKQTTLIVYSDSSPSALNSISDYVFRPASNDQLFIGKSVSDNYNGFVSYFKLWGGVINDFSGEMGDGGCGSGNGINCLWNCGFLFWGSACTACDGGCTLGCVLNGNCNICNDNLCQICSSFNSESCSQCITSAAGNPCACNSGYYKPTGLSICNQCDTSCTACSGPGYYSCTACPLGTYLLRGICMTTCPSQYSQNSTLNKCTQITNLVISGTFYEIIILNIISTFQVGSKNYNTYPSYDSNDPIPSYDRGYYFKSSSYLINSGNYMSPYFSLNFWIYPTSGGILFRKSSTLTTYISISIASGTGYPTVSLTLSNASGLNLSGTSSVLNSWNYLSIIGLVSSGKTSLSMYINDALAATSTSVNLAYLYDLGDMYIGKSSEGFAGYLWSLSAYNDETKYDADWNSAGCGGSPCPSGITLPMCSFLSYLDSSTSTCTNCLASCTNGCRNSISCGLCQMPPCYSCLSFSGPCTLCVSNASPDGNGGCACNDQYFWYSVTLKCDVCDWNCKTCLGTTYFECSECFSQYTLVGLNCLYACPYGFGSGCSPVSTPVINEFFNSSLQLTYGVFKTKMDSNRYSFFQTLDNNDAVTPDQRGLFVNEALYLQTNNFWLNHDISVGIWVNTVTDGNMLSYSSSLYNYDFVFSTDGSLLYQLCDRWRTKFKFSLASAVIPSNSWNYLSFTISYGYSSTNVNIYANGNSVTTHTNYNYIFRPKTISYLRINAYYNCFAGYIYSLQLWNALVTDFSSWIDDNICGTGLASTCLYPYTSTLYNDITTCAACDSSLTGCLRSILCNQCDDPLCATCTNFSPGSCTTCVANAAGAPSQTCACNDGYFTMYTYTCMACPAGCQHCLSWLYNSCTVCFSGYYLNNGICVSTCPDGYTMNSSTNNCDPSDSAAYFLDFYGLLKLDTIGSLNIGSDNTNTYPNYDTNDPFPAINRGYYFSGTDVASMPYMFGPTFTISIWLKALQNGTVLTKYNTNPILQIRINSQGEAILNCTMTTFWTTGSINITTDTSLFDSWYLFSTTASLFSDTSQISNLSVYGATTFNVYVNGVVDQTKTVAALSYVGDSTSGLLYIGNDNSLNNGFQGFIDRINIYTDAASYALDYVSTGCNGACSQCPSTLVCLSDCLISTYPGATCASCLSSCNNGCINGQTCRLCKQSTCLSCDEFTGDCFTCIPNAYLDIGSCYCNAYAVFDIPTQSCISCDNLCQTCASTALFECSVCGTANFLIGNLCIRECPYGFSSPSCGSVSTAVIDQTFYGDFAGSYGDFVTGMSAIYYQFWDSPESVDPTPAYKRGLYFAPGQILYSNAEIYLSHSFSIGVWVYTITNGDIIYKQTHLILASDGFLTVLLEDPNEVTASSISPAISSLSGWNYISFTVVSSSTITSVTVYSNNVAKTPVTANSMIFRDQAAKTLYIGKSTTANFKGFIYWFTLWNVPITDFSSQVNNLCGTGLGKSCLWACDINNYYTGSSCSGCNSCSLGCRRSQSCYICYDPLCTTCTGFESGECTACVSNATPTAGVCACNANYWVSGNGLSCNWACTTGCATCTGNLVYNQCTSCNTNYYLLNNQCFSSCPTGYTQDSTLNQCTNPPSSSIVTLALQNLIHLDSVDVFTVGSASNPYPSFDTADPVPSISRGYYFSSGKCMTSTTSLIISPWYTINIWAKPMSQGAIVSQLNGAVLMMGISIDSSGHVNFCIQLKDSSLVQITGTSNLFFSWHNIVFYGDIVNAYTVAYYVLDGVAKSNLSSSNKQPFISTGQVIVGKQSLTDSLGGFIWSIKIYNDNSYSLSEWITSGCATGCTNCPSEKLCPDNCGFGYFYSSSCTACSSCSYGCRSTLTCRLCKQKECLSCVDFTGDCSSCITNASLNNGSCACNSNSIWIQSSATCEICDIICSSCAGSYYFECTACIATKILVGTVCLHQCPTGFSSSGCTSTSSPVVDASLYDNFQGNYGIFNVGANPSTYYFSNSPEADDPIPAVSRGLYFSSGKFLESSVSLSLSSSFSLGFWILVESAGDILEKQSSFTMSSNGQTTITLQSPLQVVSTATASALTFTGWGYISISVKYLNGGSTITNYINNIAGTPISSTSKIFRDALSSALILGKSSSSSSFSGFLYWITVWNSALSDFSAEKNNLCGTGLGSSCLWNCDISQYYTGSACSSCSTCPLGCRRSNSCNVCYDTLCATCSFFNSGQCSACVTHASVLAGGICACNANYIPSTDGFSCVWGCYAGCASCSGTLYTQCTSCFSGWFLYDNMCLLACPTGFTQDSGLNQCTSPPTSPIISLQFQNLIILNTVNTFSIGSSSTNTYPTYDANDPLPAVNRGYYFTGASSAASTNSYIISPLYSINLWTKPISGGYMLWQLPAMLKFSFTTLGVISIILTLQDTSTVSYTSTTVLFNNWHNIAFTGDIVNTKTRISFYLDGTLVNYLDSPSSSPFVSSGSVLIGSSDGTNGFTGFLWSLYVYNDNAHALTEWIATGCSSGCSSCPSELLCPDNCAFNNFYSSSCVSCSASCSSYGCRSSLTCRLCKYKECLSCDHFDGNCFSCITNAQLNSGVCSCNSNAIWIQSSESCEICDNYCQNCIGNGYFECSACIAGKFKVWNACVNDCPTGFTMPGCVSTTSSVIDENFDTAFQGSYGIFTTALSSSSYYFYNTPETYDPIPAYHRGLYFSSGSYLESNTPIYLSHSFSIGLWMFVVGSGSVLEKQDFLYMNELGAFTLTLESPLQATTTISTASLTITNWNYISLTVKYSLGASTITVYLNDSPQAPIVSNNFIFRDIVGKTLLLGKSNASSFNGFIYHFSLWNTPITDFSSQIANLCGTGLGSNCLWPCDMNHYYSGSSCTSCSTCSLGCRLGTTCNICYDLLCDKCTGFTSGLCFHCVAHASVSSGSCTCDTNYIVSTDGLSCIWGCAPNCSGCSGTLSTQCTSCNPGYFFLNGICYAHCPTGYTEDSSLNQCTNPPSSPIISVQLENLIYLDTVNSFSVGSSNTNTYPNWDSNDPIPAIYRGYYFKTSSIMTSTNSYIISSWFTITAWVKPTGQGNFLTQLNGASQLLSISFDLNGHAVISLLLEDTSLASYTTASNLFNSWHNIAFTGTISASFKTSITFYKDGSQVFTQLSSNSSPFISSGSITIGNTGSSSSFRGFLWSIMIYNDNSFALSEWISTGCQSGCSNCPSELLCPDSCTFNQFYSSGCTSCSSSCNTYGCRSLSTCRLCKQKECLSCSKFDGPCSSCIPNASLSSGSCSCNSNAVWSQLTESCEICYSVCSGCNGLRFIDCISCSSGYFSLSNVCVQNCPSGYLQTAGNCALDTAGLNGFVIDLKLNQIKDTVIDSQLGMPFMTGDDSNFYPAYTAKDPYAAKYRGYYFQGSSYMKIPDSYASSIPSLVISSEFTIAIWINPTGSMGTLFTKQKNDGTLASLYSFGISSYNPTISLLLTDGTTTSATSLNSVSVNSWNFIAATYKIDSTQTHKLSFFINTLSTDIRSLPASSWFQDIASSYYITISSSRASSTSFSSFYTGFLYELLLYNTIISPSSLFSTSCPTCSVCPISNACYPICSISQYWDGSSCIPCDTACSSVGCKDSLSNCNLCQDPLCYECDDYASTCIQCITNAHLDSGACVCDTGYFWDEVSLQCTTCSSACNYCIEPSAFGCTDCSSGFFMIGYVCLKFCPLGYTQSGNICKLVNEFVYDMKFDKLTGVIYDSVSNIPALTGNSIEFYPNYDYYDPLPAYLRGFYFNGNTSIMHLPKYKSYASPTLVLGTIFTFSTWINTESTTGTVFYKSSHLSVGSSLLELKIVGGYPTLILLMRGIQIIHQCENQITQLFWQHIAFILSTDSTRNSVITCFINTISDVSLVSLPLQYFEDDAASISVKIGARQTTTSNYENFYKGFIYEIAIYNSVKSINDLALPFSSCTESCPACLITKKCIPNCPIMEYWKGPNCNDCGACNKNCTSSCRYSGPSCTLCGDILCYDCADYENSCIECKTNSTFNSNCICDSPFGYNSLTESCSYCNITQYRGESDGQCYECPSNCTTCKSANSCLSCIKDAIISNGACVCKPGYNFSKKVCMISLFNATLFVDYDNSLYLNFSETLMQDLTSKDIEISIFNKSKIEWSMEMRGSKEYYISILMDSDIKQNTTVTLYFVNDQILSTNNSILQEKNLTGKLYEFNYATSSSNVEAISQQTTAAIHISVATSLIMALINPDPSCLWTTLNTLQVLSFITLSGIPLSSSLYSFLNSLNSYDVIPNLYEILAPESDGKTPYKEAKEFGYKTDLILLNAGNLLTVFSAIMAVYPAIIFFSQCSNKWFGKMFTGILKHYKYSVFLRFWIQSYLDIGAPAVIGLLIFSYNNETQIVNAVICISLCMYIFATPVVLIYILYANKYQIIKRKIPFLKKFDSLFYEFKPNQGMMSYQFYTLFFIRRLIYMSSLIFLSDIPIYQGLINIVLSVVTISYLLAYRPYSDFLHQFSNIFTEIVVGIVMILTTAFVMNLGDDAELWLEKIIYVNVAAIMVIQIFASLSSFFKTIYTIVKPKILQVINSESRARNYAINEVERTITLDRSITMDHDVRNLHRLETREGDPF